MSRLISALTGLLPEGHQGAKTIFNPGGEGERSMEQVSAGLQHQTVEVVQLPQERLAGLEPQVRDLGGGGPLLSALFVFAGIAGLACGLAHHNPQSSHHAGHKPLPIHAPARQPHAGRRRATTEEDLEADSQQKPEDGKFSAELLEAYRVQRDLFNDLIRGQEKLMAAAVALANTAAAAAGRPKRVKKSKTPDVPVRGSEGRLSWDNDFREIRFGGVLHNLETRKRARFCIKYLAAWKAYDEFSARHLDKQIEPYVRAQAGMDPLPESSKDNLRIQQYFNKNKTLQKLCGEVIKSAGNGRYYLHTK